MDELFMDVTEMIDAHMKVIEVSDEPQDQEKVWFSLSRTDPSPASPGFYYDSTCFNGRTEPKQIDSGLFQLPAVRRLLVASHLGQYIRGQLAKQHNFTSSVGVSHNKLLAKLMADVHKPNLQTVLVPFRGSQYDPTIVQSFLDPLKARKLSGFGSKVLRELRAHIYGDQLHDQEAYPDSTLIVSQIRAAVSQDAFIKLFGEEQGRALYALLYGMDPSRLVPTPVFPRQIGVEDSFLKCDNMENVHQRLSELSASLLRRLDAELSPIGGILDQLGGQITIQPSTKGWEKIPRNIRFSTRFKSKGQRTTERGGYYGYKRESKSTKLPSEVISMSRNFNERVAILCDAVVQLFKKMAAGQTFDVTLFNISAVDFGDSTSASPAISAMFKRGGQSIDWEMVKALPEDLRSEILQDLVRRGATVPDDIRGGSLRQPVHEEQGPQASLSNIHDLASSPSDPLDGDLDANVDEPYQSASAVCDICGNYIPSFAMDAHVRFHSA